MKRLGNVLPFQRAYENYQQREEEEIERDYREVIERNLFREWRKHL